MAYIHPFSAGYFQKQRRTRVRRKKIKIMDLIGPRGPIKDIVGRTGKVSKKAEKAIQKTNPAARTKFYKNSSKPVQKAIDAAWMWGLTQAFNKLPLPVELRNLLPFDFGPTYPARKGRYWRDDRRYRRRR